MNAKYQLFSDVLINTDEKNTVMKVRLCALIYSLCKTANIKTSNSVFSDKLKW